MSNQDKISWLVMDSTGRSDFRIHADHSPRPPQYLMTAGHLAWTKDYHPQSSWCGPCCDVTSGSHFPAPSPSLFPVHLAPAIWIPLLCEILRHHWNPNQGADPWNLKLNLPGAPTVCISKVPLPLVLMGIPLLSAWQRVHLDHLRGWWTLIIAVPLLKGLNT